MQTQWPKWIYAVITKAGGFYRKEEEGYTLDFQMEDGAWNFIYVTIDEDRHECSVQFDGNCKWGANDAFRFLDAFKETLIREGVSFFLHVSGLDESDWSDEDYDRMERFLWDGERSYPYNAVAFGEAARSAKRLINELDTTVKYESETHIVLDGTLYETRMFLKPNARRGTVELWTTTSSYGGSKYVDKVAEVSRKEDWEHLQRGSEETLSRVKVACDAYGFSCAGIAFQGLPLYEIVTPYGTVHLSEADEVQHLYQNIRKDVRKLELIKDEIAAFLRCDHPSFQYNESFFAFGGDRRLVIDMRVPGSFQVSFLDWRQSFVTPFELKEAVIAEWEAHSSLQEKLDGLSSYPYVGWDSVRRELTEKELSSVSKCEFLINKKYGRDVYTINSVALAKDCASQEHAVEAIESVLRQKNDKVADLVEIRDRMYQAVPEFAGGITFSGEAITFNLFGYQYTLFKREEEGVHYKLGKKVLRTPDEAVECILSIHRRQLLREELKEERQWPDSPYVHRFAHEHGLMLHLAKWEGETDEFCRRLEAYYEKKPPYRARDPLLGDTAVGLAIHVDEGSFHSRITLM